MNRIIYRVALGTWLVMLCGSFGLQNPSCLASTIAAVSNLSNPAADTVTVKAHKYVRGSGPSDPGVTTRYYLYQQFTTGPTGGTLREVRQFASDRANLAMVSLAESGPDGLPGAELSNSILLLTRQSTVLGRTLFTYAMTSYSLAPNTTYWIGQYNFNEYNSFFPTLMDYTVRRTTVLSETGLPGWSLGPYRQLTTITNQPNEWGPLVTNRSLMMEIQIDAAPEPSTLFLGLSGGGLTLILWKRRRFASKMLRLKIETTDV